MQHLKRGDSMIWPVVIRYDHFVVGKMPSTSLRQGLHLIYHSEVVHPTRCVLRCSQMQCLIWPGCMVGTQAAIEPGVCEQKLAQLSLKMVLCLEIADKALHGRSACACWIGLCLEQQDLKRVLLELVCGVCWRCVLAIVWLQRLGADDAGDKKMFDDWMVAANVDDSTVAARCWRLL